MNGGVCSALLPMNLFAPFQFTISASGWKDLFSTNIEALPQKTTISSLQFNVFLS